MSNFNLFEKFYKKYDFNKFVDNFDITKINDVNENGLNILEYSLIKGINYDNIFSFLIQKGCITTDLVKKNIPNNHFLDILYELERLINIDKNIFKNIPFLYYSDVLKTYSWDNKRIDEYLLKTDFKLATKLNPEFKLFLFV